jgi:hypothetical protein
VINRILAVLAVGMLAFAACGGDSEPSAEAGDRGECSPAQAAADAPSLPGDVPVPGEVTLTNESEAGPSLIVEGYFVADIEEAFPEYRDAFEDSAWDVTGEEQEEDDAEIFFAKGEANGQVNMFAECDGRTKLRITIRPS